MKKSKNPWAIYNPVQKIAIADLLPDHSTNRRHSHVIVVDVNGTPTIVNSCSKGYYLQSNAEVIKPFHEALGKAFDVGISFTAYNHAVFFLDVIMKDSVFTAAGDKIFPRIRLQNSYNGKIRFGISAGLYRQVCSNGMVAPYIDENSKKFTFNIKGRHTESLGAKANVDKLLELAHGFIEGTKSLRKPIELLSSKKVRGNVEELVKKIAEEVNFPTKQVQAVLDRMNEEVVELNTPLTHWLLYNGFNYQLNHNDSIKTMLHKKEQLDNRLFRTIYELSQKTK